MTGDVKTLLRKAADTPVVEADLLRLTRDYDALSKNYQELVQRRETANLAKQMDTQTRRVEFRVVEPPVVPLRPSSPWRGPLIAAAALAGLAAGVGLAVLRLTLRRQVTRPEQLLNAFDIPIAGVVRQISALGLWLGVGSMLPWHVWQRRCLSAVRAVCSIVIR